MIILMQQTVCNVVDLCCFFIPVIQIEMTSLCMTVAISATVSLFCLFAPKVYIVVFQPHKNVRQSVGPNSILSSSIGALGKSTVRCVMTNESVKTRQKV